MTPSSLTIGKGITEQYHRPRRVKHHSQLQSSSKMYSFSVKSRHRQQQNCERRTFQHLFQKGSDYALSDSTQSVSVSASSSSSSSSPSSSSSSSSPSST